MPRGCAGNCRTTANKEHHRSARLAIDSAKLGRYADNRAQRKPSHLLLSTLALPWSCHLAERLAGSRHLRSRFRERDSTASLEYGGVALFRNTGVHDGRVAVAFNMRLKPLACLAPNHLQGSLPRHAPLFEACEVSRCSVRSVAGGKVNKGIAQRPEALKIHRHIDQAHVAAKPLSAK